MKRIFHQHWFCIIPLLPAVVMIWIHEAFGISDEMGGHIIGQREATISEVLYNYAIVAAIFAGIAGFVVHFVALANRGIAWMIIKLLLLALGVTLVWWAMIVAFP